MVKLHSLTKHNIDDIPEEIFQRIIALNNKLVPAIAIVLAEYKEDPNIILVSLGRIYASFITCLISEDIEEQRKAAKLYARLLIDEVERYNEIKKK